MVDPYLIWHADRVVWLGEVEEKCTKNNTGGMPSIPGSWVTGRRILYLADGGGEVGIKRETEGVVQLPQVQEKPDEGVTG